MSILSSKNLMAPLTLLPVLLTISCAAHAQKYEPLTIHGTDYPNACSPETWERLKAKLVAAEIPDPLAAWHVVELILCSPKSPTTVKSVRALMPARIHSTAEATGDQPDVNVVTPDDTLIDGLMAEGKAWRARIRKEGGNLVLQYAADEACLKSATLSYTKHTWLVSAIGSACD